MDPFLCGRLRGCSSVAGWEHHTWCIYQERIICHEITHQGPQTWFSMFNVPYRPMQPPFLGGRLGVMGVPHWPGGSLPYKTGIGIESYGQILHIWGPRGGFQCLMCFTCPIVLSNASIPQWPVGSNGVFLTGRLGVSHMMHISRKDYFSRNNTSGTPDMVFNVWCALTPHKAAVPQWPVGSNVAFLTGRLGVSHITYISRDDYLSRNNTSGPPDMVFNVQCASRAPYCCQMQPFLSGRLGVMWRSSLAGWEYHT